MPGPDAHAPAKNMDWVMKSVHSLVKHGLRPLRVIVAVFLLIIGLATLLFTADLLVRLHVPLLAWDEWYVLLDFQSYIAGTYRFSDLIAQHNEHRILFTRLVYFIDAQFFHLNGSFSIAVTFFLQILNAMILIWLNSKLIQSWWHRTLLAGFVLLMLFTLRQEQNFTNGFQVCFMGVFTAAALGIMAYVGGLEKLEAVGGQPWGRFAWAALACTVSAYTMANGVLTGCVLAVVALLWRAPWWIPVVTLALSAALAWLFFYHYVPGGGPPLSQVLVDPLPYVSYMAAYLGNPIEFGSPATQTLGALGLLATAAGAFRVVTGRERQPASLMLLAIAGFIVACAAATAYGRISLGIEQASESRYATLTEIFWTALVLFWYPVATHPRASWPSTLGLGAVIVLLSLSAVYSEITAWPVLVARAAAFHHVSDGMLSGVYDAEAASYENMTKDEISQFVPFLRAHQLSLFAEPIAEAYGRNIATLGTIAPSGTCRGSLKAEADPTLGNAGVRLSGDISEETSLKASRRIIIVAASGTIVGYGSGSLPGEKARDWNGYAKSGVGDMLDAYARLEDGTFCDLGRTDVKSPASE